MNRMIKYGLLVTMFFMASCGDFLEPKSQSEYVPKLVKSLDELLLGEVYMGPGYSDGQFYGVLGLFDDDVAIRPDWKANASEEEKINKIRMAYTWAKNMKDGFSGYNTYGEVYKKILGCNSVLDYIDEVQGSEEERNRVMAQALAFRGYFYFHLINLYGKPYSVGKDSPGVPLKLTAEMGTSGMKRNTVEEVYTQIIQDLLEAERLFKTLPEGEWSLQNNRINLPCVQLLISRVYLYMENWAQALAYGEKVITDYGYEVLDLNGEPLPNEKMNPTYRSYYTWENPEIIFLFGNQGDVLELPLTRVYYSGDKGFTSYIPAVASDNLIRTYDLTDLRRDHYLMWEVIDYGYTPRYKKAVSKFEAVSNYNIEVSWNGGKWGVAFKVTEAYLNAAEGAAMLYKETGNGEFQIKAQALLDKLRVKRFSAAAFVSTDISAADELIAFVRDERRRELCFENHRWFDLRRYGMEEIKHVWYDASGNASEYVLEKNDPGFTLQLPNEAFEYNSGLEQNEPRK